MRKLLLVLVSVLLLTGVAYATDWQTALTADISARNVGRNVVTNSSAIIKIWADAGASANPGIGVSNSTGIILYSNLVTQVGYTIDTNATATDTVGEVVDYINTNFASDSSVKLHAAVGSDAYRDMAATELVPANIIAATTTRDSSTAIVYKQTNDKISAGVEDSVGTTIRLKRINSTLPIAQNPTLDGVAISVYDGNTRVWRTFISNAAYISATNPSSSANSITFGEKGLSATKGNSLCVLADGERNVGGDTTSVAQVGISIVYDQYKD